MNQGNANQQWQQQQQQGVEQTLTELTQEAAQKQYKLNTVLVNSAQKKAVITKLNLCIATIKRRVENSYAMKNAVAKMCNSSLDWAQGAQKSVDKITGAIQVGMQHVARLNEQEQQEIRRLELELAQLTTEDELQENDMKTRKWQQQLDDLNKIIKELEDKLNVDGKDEDTLFQKIKEVNQSTIELQKSESEQSDSDGESTKRETFTKLGSKEFLVKYFKAQKEPASAASPKVDAMVTSTKADPCEKDGTRFAYTSDGSMSP